MKRVTADDLALADALLDACAAYASDAKSVRVTARNTIAQVIADIHERAVACASVRLEREYGLVQKALRPGRPR